MCCLAACSGEQDSLGSDNDDIVPDSDLDTSRDSTGVDVVTKCRRALDALQDMRVAVADAEAREQEAGQREATLQQQLDDLRDQLADEERQRTALEDRIADLTAELEDATAAGSASGSAEELAAAQERVVELEAALATLTSDHAAVTHRLQQTETDLDATQFQVDGLTAEVTRLQAAQQATAA